MLQLLIPLKSSVTLYWKEIFASVSLKLLLGLCKVTVGPVVSTSTLMSLISEPFLFVFEESSVQLTCHVCAPFPISF